MLLCFLCDAGLCGGCCTFISPVVNCTQGWRWITLRPDNSLWLVVSLLSSSWTRMRLEKCERTHRHAHSFFTFCHFLNCLSCWLSLFFFSLVTRMARVTWRTWWGTWCRGSPHPQDWSPSAVCRVTACSPHSANTTSYSWGHSLHTHRESNCWRNVVCFSGEWTEKPDSLSKLSQAHRV